LLLSTGTRHGGAAAGCYQAYVRNSAGPTTLTFISTSMATNHGLGLGQNHASNFLYNVIVNIMHYTNLFIK
jgi:hypothetical protein